MHGFLQTVAKKVPLVGPGVIPWAMSWVESLSWDHLLAKFEKWPSCEVGFALTVSDPTAQT